ncbi:MAG TPA: anti-sigma factor [Gemmataceae bacterium]|nr:anti-sigma factor [Gemmataceae bacterium]
MNCPENRDLHAYLDEELDPARRAAFAQHLPGCSECTRDLEAQRALRTGLRDGGFRVTAPVALRERIRSSLRPAVVAPARRMLLPWLAAAALLIGVLGAAAGTYLSLRRPADSLDVPRQLVSAHVRSLMEKHLCDVESTDKHTVKPWFQGKVDFSLPVKDFKDQEYPLEGGRLDYLNDRPVAALVYRRHKHVINLFVWPASEAEASPQATTRRGYNLLHWTQDGLHFWAVSDLNAEELAEFGRLQREAP